MGTLSNLFELVRDSSYRDIEEEASREVAIALAGNSLEARDQLHKALSLPMESLWSANPLRLVDTSEHPSADGESGGLLLYAISEYDRIPDNKRSWLEQVAAAPNTSIIMVVLPRGKAKEEAPARERNLGRRLKGLNPLKLVGGNGSETGDRPEWARMARPSIPPAPRPGPPGR